MSNCFIKQSAPEYVAAITNGELPDSIDELTEYGRAMICVNSRSAQILAIIVAAGRDHFGKDLTRWINWCSFEFKIDNAAYRCHLLQIGKMLNGLRKDHCFIKQYKQAIELSTDKLLAISRISFDQIPAFLSHYPDLDTMKREQVRTAVCEYLGESVPVAEQPELPGFEAALDKLIDLDYDKVMEVSNGKGFDTETALKMTYSGITLCLASAKSLTEHIDELPAEAVDELLENLDTARNRIAAAVTEHRRKLLNN